MPLPPSTSTCLPCNVHLQSMEKPAARAVSLTEEGQGCSQPVTYVQCCQVLKDPLSCSSVGTASTTNTHRRKRQSKAVSLSECPEGKQGYGMSVISGTTNTHIKTISPLHNNKTSKAPTLFHGITSKLLLLPCGHTAA